MPLQVNAMGVRQLLQNCGRMQNLMMKFVHQAWKKFLGRVILPIPGKIQLGDDWAEGQANFLCRVISLFGTVYTVTKTRYVCF